MKRDDHVAAIADPWQRLALRAKEFAADSISDAESELCPVEGFNAESLEGITCLLYMQLDIARRRRMSLDAAKQWDQAYVIAHRERETAIAHAHRHYMKLMSMPNGPGCIDAYLAQLIASEGLTP